MTSLRARQSPCGLANLYTNSREKGKLLEHRIDTVSLESHNFDSRQCLRRIREAISRRRRGKTFHRLWNSDEVNSIRIYSPNELVRSCFDSIFCCFFFFYSAHTNPTKYLQMLSVVSCHVMCHRSSPPQVSKQTENLSFMPIVVKRRICVCGGGKNGSFSIWNIVPPLS